MIIFLYGPDTFRSKEKLRGFKEKFTREIDKSGLSLIELEGEKININELNKAISTQSFFSSKRMVVIKHIFSQKKAGQTEILELLKKIQKNDAKDDNILIFWDEKPDKRSTLFKFLNASKFKEEFNVLENNNLVNWIKTRIEEKGGKINWQAAQILASKSDGNLWALSGEIDKLLALKKGEEIEIADLEFSSLAKIDDNIFNITEAIAKKNTALALQLVNENLEEGMNGIYLLTMIARQFRILLQIKKASEGNQRVVAKELGLHPFVVQKAVPQAANYTMDKLKEIYKRLLEIDRQLKLGGEEKVLLESFVVEAGE